MDKNQTVLVHALSGGTLAISLLCVTLNEVWGIPTLRYFVPTCMYIAITIVAYTVLEVQFRDLVLAFQPKAALAIVPQPVENGITEANASAEGGTTELSSLPFVSSFTIEPRIKEDIQPIVEEPSPVDRYEELLAESNRKDIERRKDIVRCIKEYTVRITAGYLNKLNLERLLANIDRLAYPDGGEYMAVSCDMNKLLHSPDLRHYAWNVGERLGISMQNRAVFIKACFPTILRDAGEDYLKRNLRDSVASHIRIDVPAGDDYSFHDNSFTSD